MRLLILGENSYVGTSVQNYCKVAHPDLIIDVFSSFQKDWEEKSFKGYDAVYNVSGLAHADSRHGTPEMYRTINTELPINMAKKAKADGVEMFIQMSSAIIYGNMSRIGEDNTIDENTLPSPVNVYGESKLNAEKGLLELKDDSFKVTILRCPLIYGENAKDNFPRLVRYAKKMPVFPQILNKQSMIYADNLAELVYLIIKNKASGVFMPQEKEYICTSKIVKDIAEASGKKMILTKLFNPLIWILSRKIYIFNKVFGNVAYSQATSEYFDGLYRVVSYEEAIKRIAESSNC